MLACILSLVALNGFVHGEIGRPSTNGGRGEGAGLLGAGPVLDLRHTSVRSAVPRARQVALTFDDGPDPGWTPQILDVLRAEHVPATFFVVGARAAEHPGLVRREFDEGHEVGIHTFTHADLATVPGWRSNLELTLTQQVLTGIIGHTTMLMRPPYSSTPDNLHGTELASARHISKAGYLVVLSDHDSRDWERPGVSAIVRNAMPRHGQGAVVLLHDGGGNRSETVAAVRELIHRLKADGYRFVPVSALTGLPRDTVMARADTGNRLRGQVLLGTIRLSDVALTALRWALVIMVVLSLARIVLSLVMAYRHARRSRARARAAPPVTDLPPVSIIVPAYNEEVGIEATVRSLLASRHRDIEVVVVDDGSTDSTATRAKAAAGGDPRVRVMNRPNGGKPAALNTGVAAASYDFVVLMDGDTVFQPDTVERLVGPLHADSSIGAVSGNAKVGNRRGVLGLWQHLEYVFGFNLDRRLFDLLGCITTVPGAVGAFRRQALIDVGGISDDTLAEDTDVTMALVRGGWRVVYQADALAWTEVPASLGSLWRQRYRWSYGTLQSMWKHRRAVREGRSLGWVALPWMAVFQLLLPVLAPVVDVWALYTVLFGDAITAAWVWGGLMVLQAGVGAYALRLDRERLRDLWALPLQQFVYRQIMYLVVIQSLVAAVQGQRLRWHKLRRLGLEPRPQTGSTVRAHDPL